MKKLALENRIALLKTRPKDNANIIRKLERQLRKVNDQNDEK